MALPGAGAIRFWGFSPALNLLDLLDDAPPSADADARRVLLVSPGDVRHVLKTLAAARAAATTTIPLEFSIFEQAPEALARHLLLVAVALDFELPRRERAELLLELLANALLREKTAAYLAAKARALQRLFAHEEGPLVGVVDLSLLKMKQRDEVEAVFGTWLEEVPFDVVRLRDERLRRLYQERYDARRNVLDWDYNMELVPVGATIVHKIHFREWRMTGIAYELRDSSYSCPNRSLASMAAGRENGRSVMKRGFWGDVANSPWAGWGVECDEARLTKKRSDQHIKSSCDVAYYNVISWLTQIETGRPFELKEGDVADFEYGSSVATAGTANFAKGFLSAKAAPAAPLAAVEEVAEAAEAADDDVAAAAADDGDAARAAAAARVVAAKMAALPPFRLRLLCGSWSEVERKGRHRGAYEAMVVGSHVAELLLSPHINGVLRPKAAVALETAKYICESHKKKKAEFGRVLLRLAACKGWAAKGRADPADAATLAELVSPDDLSGTEVAHILFSYDEATAAARGEAAKKLIGVGASPAKEQLALAAPADDADAGGADADAAAATGGGAAAAVDLGLRGAAEEADDAAALTAKVGAAAIKESKEEVAVATRPGAPVGDALGGGDKRCAITGEPAKYKDPVSGLHYANLDAFRELCKLHPRPSERLQPNAPADGDAAATGAADGVKGAPQRPIVISSGGAMRQVNKVVR